jgi:hypothetical protein
MKLLLYLALFLVTSINVLNGQVGIGTKYPDASSILDLTSNTKGMLPPRLSTIEIDSIKTPATGLLVYNITLSCLQVNDGTPFDPSWNCISGKTANVFSLDCANATNNGVLSVGSIANNVRTIVSYNGANGGTYGNQIVSSTGVTGLTATLSSGKLSNDSGSVTYIITGTAASSGTASFTITLGGQTCTFTRNVVAAAISTIDCSNSTNNGTLVGGVNASGVSSVIGYTGGNGGAHSGQIVASMGVTGLTATLSSGNFTNGNGTFTYNITGTPASSGTASFNISIGGKTCVLNRSVNPSQSEQLIASNEVRVLNSQNHAVFKGTDGKLYSWGDNDHGQLGIGNPLPYHRNPKPVTTNLSGKSFLQSTSGHWGSSVALTNDGEVYYVGASNKGGNGSNLFTRAILGGSTAIKGLVMATSEGGTIVVGNDNKLYGIGYFGNSGTPDGIVRQINMPSGVTTSNIKFITGSHHWNIIATSTNLYCIGDGSFGNSSNYNSYIQYNASIFTNIEGLRVARDLAVVKDNGTYKFCTSRSNAFISIPAMAIGQVGQSIESFHVFGKRIIFQTSTKFSFYNTDAGTWEHINFPSGKTLEWYVPEKISSTIILCKFKDNTTNAISFMGIGTSALSNGKVADCGGLSFINANLNLSDMPSNVTF